MSFFSRFYDFEKFPGIPREKFPNSQFFPFPWEKNLGGKTETLALSFCAMHNFIDKKLVAKTAKANNSERKSPQKLQLIFSPKITSVLSCDGEA